MPELGWIWKHHVLDCYAGSKTTAHAVLTQNAKDGGNRRFILVEMEDFTEIPAAGRARQAIREHDGPQTGFDYYVFE